MSISASFREVPLCHDNTQGWKGFFHLYGCVNIYGLCVKCLLRSTDPHVPDFPVIVNLVGEHNHNLFVAEALKHRDVGEDVRKKMEKLFEAGHSPSSAWDIHKYDLRMEYGDDYVFASADGAICPSLQYCYR